MKFQINYKRIAEFLYEQEVEAIKNKDTSRFEIVRKKLNRLFLAWGKSRKNMKKISEIKYSRTKGWY